MTRIAVTTLVASVLCALSAVPVRAQSALTDGIYLVSVTGTATDTWNLNADFRVSLPGVLVVYPQVTAERPAEMCLFINNPPGLLPTTSGPTGASWLASRLGCGSSGQGGGAFTSLTDALVGSIFAYRTDTYDAVIATAPLGDDRTQSAAAGVNAFLSDTGEIQAAACILVRCDPPKKLWNLASGGYWYAITYDKGETVSGVIEVTGSVPGTSPLYPARYSARFEGKLFGRLQ
jgi:hypothetical protein